MTKSKRNKRKLSGWLRAQSGALAHLNRVMAQVDQLLAVDDVIGALDLLEANRNRLGQYAPLNAALATLYGTVGRFWDAAVHARLALELDPKNPDMYLLAAMSYMVADFGTLAHRACREWLRSGSGGPALLPMREFDQEHRQFLDKMRAEYDVRDYKTAEEAAYLLDLGRWALTQNNWADALKHSQAAVKLAPKWPPPRNNASMTLLFLGRYAEAIAEAEKVLADCEPENVQALANLVRAHIMSGHSDTAAEYGERLAQLPLPETPLGATKQIEGLSFLDRDADILRIAQAAEKRFGVLAPQDLTHYGIAEANRGRRKKALSLLRRAQEAGDDSPLLKTTLGALEAGQPGPGIADRYPQTHFSDLLDRHALEQAGLLFAQDAELGTRDHVAWARLRRQYPLLPQIAARMFYETPEAVLPMTDLLVALGAPQAREFLLSFVEGQLGSQGNRMAVLRIMQEHGLTDDSIPINMWIDGQQRPIGSYMMEISDDHFPDYPDGAWALYEKALAAHHADRIDEAERLYHELLQAAPNVKEAYQNLAVIAMARGDTDQANALIDQALEVDPLYVFARGARVRQALVRNDIAAAKEWLAPLAKVRQWHPAEFVYYQKTLAHIALAEKEYEAAEKCLELAQQFSEDDPEIEDLLGKTILLKNVRALGDRFQESAERYHQRRLRAKLPADPTLKDCFNLLTKDDMTDIRQALGITGISAYKKAQLSKYLMNVLASPEDLTWIVQDQLNDAERGAIHDLLDHDGVMDRERFLDKYAENEENPGGSEFGGRRTQSVPGRLRAHGLLFEGTAGNRVIVAIPREIRPILREILAGA